MLTEADLFSVPNDCLLYDKLWGPSQRVVTLFDFFQKTKNTAPFSIVQLQGKSEYITLTIDINFDSRNKRKKTLPQY